MVHTEFCIPFTSFFIGGAYGAELVCLLSTARASGQNSEAVSQKYGYLLADLYHEEDSIWGSKLGVAIFASYHQDLGFRLGFRFGWFRV